MDVLSLSVWIFDFMIMSLATAGLARTLFDQQLRRYLDAAELPATRS